MSKQRVDVVDKRTTHSSDVEIAIDINAPADVVFDFLTVPDLAFRWMGLDGEIDPSPGGDYTVRFTDDDIAAGRYVDVIRPTRVSWTWGWMGSDEIPPGSSLVTFDLAEIDGVTTVTVTHTGLPDIPAAAAHTDGWTYWGSRLALSVTGGDPDTAEWPESQSEHSDDEEASHD